MYLQLRLLHLHLARIHNPELVGLNSGRSAGVDIWSVLPGGWIGRPDSGLAALPEVTAVCRWRRQLLPAAGCSRRPQGRAAAACRRRGWGRRSAQSVQRRTGCGAPGETPPAGCCPAPTAALAAPTHGWHSYAQSMMQIADTHLFAAALQSTEGEIMAVLQYIIGSPVPWLAVRGWTVLSLVFGPVCNEVHITSETGFAR